MLLGANFDAFIKASPLSVMTRGLIERFYNPACLDQLFEEHAIKQYTRTLPFSTVAEVMSDVVFTVFPSVGASLQSRDSELPVSRKAFYDKLNGIEPCVGRALVTNSAKVLVPVLDALNMRTRPLLAGYKTRILDGNHFAATEHRLDVLRGETAAPLPGQALAVLDADRQLICDLFPCEDGHAQERSLLGDVLLTVAARDLWIADRNFCTLAFLSGIARRLGCFAIRLHASMPVRTTGKRVKRGYTQTGAVFEERVVIVDPESGRDLKCRLVTLVLETPTRDGEREIRVITNLPAEDATAVQVVTLYRQRWSIESMFQDLTTHLKCEIRTLAYPKAAIFAFSLAVLSWNLISIVRASLGAVHGEEAVDDNVSSYYVSLEISQVVRGMMIAIPADEWIVFRTATAQSLAALLKRLAARADLRKYQSHPRGPRKAQAKRKNSGNGQHVSTTKPDLKRAFFCFDRENTASGAKKGG